MASISIKYCVNQSWKQEENSPVFPLQYPLCALCYDIISENKLPGSLIHLVRDFVHFNLASG